MQRVEHLHLEHVLQTVCVLESVVLRSFGPEGGQVLFTRDTGQAMLSRSGTTILTALRLEHPLARMVVECALKHSTLTGDGSKTFILLLASLLRMIQTTASKDRNVSRAYNSREAAESASARHLADQMLAFALEELDDLIAVGVAPYGCCLSCEDLTVKTQSSAHANNQCVQKLLASFFHSRLGRTHCDFISNLTCELLTCWKFTVNCSLMSSLQFLNDNFPALHTPISGFPISCSRLVEGQIIHRDFATPVSKIDHQPVKAVVFKGYLQPQLLGAGEVLELGCGQRGKEGSIVQFSAWAEKSLKCVIASLQSLGVSVILSAVKQSAAALALAAQAEICIVECVSEDELSVFAQLSGATPISDCCLIEPGHIATLTFCRPTLLGASQYVHVSFQESEEKVKPCSLVICGPGDGQTDQYARALQDAIRMLLTTFEPSDMSANTAPERTWQSKKSTSLQTNSPTLNVPPLQRSVLKPGCVIPAGGTFEFLLNHALLQHNRSCSVSGGTNIGTPAVFRLLANAVLSVPQQIYSHSLRRFLRTQTRLLSVIQNHSHPVNLVYKQEHSTILLQGRGKSECPLEEGKESTHCCRAADFSSEVFMWDCGLESVSCKYQLLLAVLQCLSSLLHVDAILHTHTALHLQLPRLGRIPWEGTEGESED